MTLACFSDLDCPASQHKNFFYSFVLWHFSSSLLEIFALDGLDLFKPNEFSFSSIKPLNLSKTNMQSCGPGDASGRNCTAIMGLDLCSMPSMLSSSPLTNHTLKSVPLRLPGSMP